MDAEDVPKTVEKIVNKHIAINEQDFESFNNIRKKYNLSWNDVFKRFKLYQNGIEYIFSAPGEMSKQLRLDLNTIMGLMSLWLTNIKDNWYLIDKNPDISEIQNTFNRKKAVIIAAGPSLIERKSLQVLRESDRKDMVIFSTLHSLESCLEAGIVPQFTGVVDASNLMVNFLKNPIIEEYADQITLICCASTHPDVFKEWKGKKLYFFRSGIPQDILPNTDTFLSILLPKLTEMETGGNSGSSMYAIANFLGCNPIGTIGFDFGYPKGHPYDKTAYFHAYSQSIGVGGKEGYKDVIDMISKCYEDFHHPVFGTDSYFDFVYGVFRNSLFEMAKYHKVQNPQHRLINCTEGGTIYTEDGSIECMPLKEFLDA